MTRLVLGVALVVLLLGSASARLALRPTFPPDAARAVRTQGGGCADACRSEHSQCRIRTKGAPSCDARLQQCLQACLAGKRH